MPGKIFVNYRRDDAAGDARGVRDALVAKFGKTNVFVDVDNLMPGQRRGGCRCGADSASSNVACAYYHGGRLLVYSASALNIAPST
jgi:hypothetical protein